MPSFTTSPKRGKIGAKLARPFYTSALIITVLATYALFVRRLNPPQPSVPGYAASQLSRRAEDEDCRLVHQHQASDQCAFILANCQDDEAGLLSYLKFYYCDLGQVQPVAFVLLVVWLGLLFTTIGIAASDFFSINLSTIASILGLSESLAGVTFLAFGNGSPDVFSTFAAMGSNSGSMAVGELIGAASFITAVVAGSMALVREFKVARRTFVRDICFFLAAVSFSMVFLADGHLHLWECCVMIGFYVFYVLVVVGWHWLSTRRRRRRQKEAASRSHFDVGAAQPSDELEPYRDDDGDDGDANDAEPDIGALERGPRIELGRDNEDDADSDHALHVAAEMTSSMRVNRPRGTRSNTTLGQIRPSFVGALEFRSVLASLQKSGNVRLAPMHSRGYSEHFGYTGGFNLQLPTPAGGPDDANSLAVPPGGGLSPGRDRAQSFGDLPMHWNTSSGVQAPAIVTQSPNSPGMLGSPAVFPPISQTDGSLAPPPDMHRRMESDEQSQGSLSVLTTTSAPADLRLQIPPSTSATSSGYSTPSLSPFPGISESPLPMTPNGPSPTLTPLFANGASGQSYFGVEIQDRCSKPVWKWWPYSVLPPPAVVGSTLFPTLQAFETKSIWDQFVSVISVPSIFLLVITLPVVETEINDDDSSERNDAIAQPLGPPTSLEQDASIVPETEWQRYRRNTRSGVTTPALLDLTRPSSAGYFPADGAQAPSQMPGQPPHLTIKPTQQELPVLLHRHETETQTSEDACAAGWNRWLVVVQLFAGPLFTAFIVWANMVEDLDQPGKTLVRMLLASLVGSLVLLAVLLATTSPDVRPRFHSIFSFAGFLVAIAWISTVAGEVVGALKAFGVILGISEEILGLTIFAVGNSLGDLVADITVARLGYPVMALSACFGGPMLNILLGVGIGGAWMTTKAANEKRIKHPDRPLHYKPYRIQVGGTLMISAITVLVTLVFLLIAVPSNKWVMSRKIGWSLIAIWSISTVLNLVVELTGVWSETS